ncbi:serpin family protein [Brachybacterium sp. DNPG3]
MTSAAPAPRPVRLPRRGLLALPPAVLASSALLAGCDLDSDGVAVPEDLRSDVSPDEPQAPGTIAGRLTPFAARMLGGLDAEETNLVCSPVSVQVALTMAGLGAAGDTLAQMEEVLGADMTTLAEAASTLRSVLFEIGREEAEAAEEEGGEDRPEPPAANLANAVWIQDGLDVESDYLDALARHLDAGLHTADFADESAREDARTDMNAFVAEQTDDLIEELVPEGALSESTRLALINALRLSAPWPEPLSQLGDLPFTRADGTAVDVPMLEADTTSWYEDDVCQATMLPSYGGDLGLVLVRPTGAIADVVDAWASDGGTGSDGAALLDALLAAMGEQGEPVQVTLPAFDIDWRASLVDVLSGLGMEDAFGAADFSGITTAEELVISDVLHEAVITVDQNGMEAAAATAVLMEESAADVGEPRTLALDVPFLYLAIERSTLTPLVVGWIGDPSQTRG